MEGINFPLLSDFWPHGEVASRYGVLTPEGVTQRVIIILDKEGVIRYTKVYDSGIQPENGFIFEQIRKIDPDAKLEENPVSSQAELAHGGVVMYCSKWCADCRKARDWLDEHNIEYREVDVYETPEALEQTRAWGDGYLITPTFNIDGTIVLDFDKERLQEVLGI
jgi:glutaredoxin